MLLALKHFEMKRKLIEVRIQHASEFQVTVMKQILFRNLLLVFNKHKYICK